MRRRQHQRRVHTLYGIGIHIVLLFTLVPLFAVLHTQAQKERVVCTEYSTFSLSKDLEFYRGGEYAPKHKLSPIVLRRVTSVVLRTDERGSIHWFEKDRERFVFPREHYDRFRRYFRRLASRIYEDSTRIFLVEMKCHPATTYNDAFYIIETGLLGFTHMYITEYNAPREASDSFIRLVEHTYPVAIYGVCGGCIVDRRYSPPRLSRFAQWYSQAMEYLGFPPEMYWHNIALFQ